MQKHTRVLISILSLFLISGCGKLVSGADNVKIDFTMANRAVDWLELINSGADDRTVKDYFMKKVAPTDGCQSIIHHWARFMDWNNEEFYKFIMEALGRIPSDRPLKDDNGNLTSFGKRCEFWQTALSDPKKIRSDIDKMTGIDLIDTSLTLAKKYLPDDAKIDISLYIVLFGGSNAYSVGDENGYDLLQLPKDDQGNIDLDEVINTFAHEIHHSGFSSLNENHPDKILLVAVLAAEGMPTYFINQTGRRIEKYSSNPYGLRALEAKDWKTHQAVLPELYQKAEDDIKTLLASQNEEDDIFGEWMSGVKGPAYVLGSDMFSKIDKYLGVDSAKTVAGDYRKFLDIYNKAAVLANQNGENAFIFDREIVRKVLEY